MSFETVFSVASGAAMLGWGMLVILPRWANLIRILRFGLVGALCASYGILIFLYFFEVRDGGYNSLAEVRALFASDGVLTAGWLHYLAFDLFIGTWIAVEADRLRIHRLIQSPILIVTFMFGPIGLFIFYLTCAADQTLIARKS